jgi:AraC family transcriptional regulator, transcriptional activator of pobA
MDSGIPVLNLQDFQKSPEQYGFYANRMVEHIQNHDVTKIPHKHDFYLVVLFTSGNGTHEIDFRKHSIKKGSLFVMKPGQMHTWKLSKDIDGYVFFHSRNFYDEGYTENSIQDFPFYGSYQTSPHIQLKTGEQAIIQRWMKELIEEYKNTLPLKSQRLRALMNLIYIELSRSYKPGTQSGKENYLKKLREFEELLNKHFKKIHLAGEYARMLAITEKHLNRIVQTCLKKTSSQLIAERIILEAKRMLIHSKYSIAEISDKLGYKDSSYFVRFFKKHAGKTPGRFIDSYRSNRFN